MSLASRSLVMEAARLLLTVLCEGDRSNEAIVFRVLPEAFRAFLTTSRLSGVDLLVAQMSAARAGGGNPAGGSSHSESRSGVEKGYTGRASFLRSGGSFIASGGGGGGGGVGVSTVAGSVGMSQQSSSSSGPMQVGTL